MFLLTRTRVKRFTEIFCCQIFRVIGREDFHFLDDLEGFQVVLDSNAYLLPVPTNYSDLPIVVLLLHMS